ncbi:MAG TPA: cell envelope integrity protein TolA [Kofleriaceae bacterium]|nr:cell envelope integrity protein TolA [Kofleriaceae bacterium]
MIVALALAVSMPARAEVLADGSYAPTGNGAIDAALVVVNAMNKEIKDQQDLQQVFINRAKLEKSLDARMDQLRANAKKIHELRAQALTEADKLRKGKAERLREAGGDKAKEADLEKAAADREAELKKAADKLNAAEKTLKEAAGFGDTMRKTLHQLGSRRDDKQALADWEGGLRHNFSTAQQKAQAKLDQFGSLVSEAAAIIQKGSGLDTSHETYGNFQARVKSNTGKKIELWIDGQKITGNEPVRLEGNELELRAVLVDARRKQSREIKTQHVTVTVANDYELAYELGTRKSDWKVTKEEYTWKDPDTRTGAKLMVKRETSGNNAKDDTLVITFSGDTASETIKGSVDGDIAWKNGATEETDSESAGFEIAIEPAK